MADMRLSDWITIGVALLIVAGSMLSVMFLIVLWPRIVSSVSSQWRASLDRARAQKARRDRRYGYGIEPDDIGMEPPVPGLVLRASEAEYTGTSVPVPEIASRADVLDILACVRVDGKYLFTGNKLADLFTGTAYAASRNTILDEIAAIRNPEKSTVLHRPGAPLKRPVNGWN